METDTQRETIRNPATEVMEFDCRQGTKWPVWADYTSTAVCPQFPKSAGCQLAVNIVSVWAMFFSQTTPVCTLTTVVTVLCRVAMVQWCDRSGLDSITNLKPNKNTTNPQVAPSQVEWVKLPQVEGARCVGAKCNLRTLSSKSQVASTALYLSQVYPNAQLEVS